MINDKIYAIWLQSALGISTSVKSAEIISYFGSAKSLYFAGEYEWKVSGVLTPTQIEKIKRTDIESAQRIFEQCVQNHWNVVTAEDKKYPSMLFNLPNYPIVLYVNGDLDCLKNRIAIAVVGTREPTRNSACIARALCASMSRAGAVIISGGALGIDSASHTGALDAKGKTVAVLGCGFNCNYLEANRALRNEISKSGALITEYPPDTQALGRNFPVRNRIISGLAYGTVVIEAGEKSGSLITARYALEQGRDVFAVPGDITSSGFTGANKLIHDGAKPVFSAMDVLEEYAMLHPEYIDYSKIEPRLTMQTYSDPPSNKPFDDNPKKNEKGEVKFVKFPEPPLLSDDAKKIYRLFNGEDLQAEDIILKTGLDAGSFSSAVTELEMFDLIESKAGKKYTLKKQK
jgi:DNA processing protein